ncbi:glycoside hydrolase superfamily [Penicillium cf. griseofulvum]|uniref:Glycoside hydrolase superfamily n=1 Tax=Penicillium cf. griseofulvum TaxID=2972120 RepID=A0A9W9MS61_9EURO|nr:glycoside hydrolase superfamily [Penicillium cf. griseofulvum]KAJ5440458.1 glycoside hydrolase superfamily [Penicillium cf. griseofulvum]KAJ5448505.1 glycoside hydrolase superfamily [Penicillium cf. griseofulvum]
MSPRLCIQTTFRPLNPNVATESFCSCPGAPNLPEDDPGSKEDSPRLKKAATPALAIITKAGVLGNKVVVGVTSHGRFFKGAEAEPASPSSKRQPKLGSPAWRIFSCVYML